MLELLANCTRYINSSSYTSGDHASSYNYETDADTRANSVPSVSKN